MCVRVGIVGVFLRALPWSSKTSANIKGSMIGTAPPPEDGEERGDTEWLSRAMGGEEGKAREIVRIKHERREESKTAGKENKGKLYGGRWWH